MRYCIYLVLNFSNLLLMINGMFYCQIFKFLAFNFLVKCLLRFLWLCHIIMLKGDFLSSSCNSWERKYFISLSSLKILVGIFKLLSKMWLQFNHFFVVLVTNIIIFFFFFFWILINDELNLCFCAWKKKKKRLEPTMPLEVIILYLEYGFLH